MEILLSGCSGRICRQIAGMEREGLHISAGVDREVPEGYSFSAYPSFESIKENVDVIIDFSNASNTSALFNYAVRTHTPVVVGTTGQKPEDFLLIGRCSYIIPVFLAVNFSAGYPVLSQSAKLFSLAMDNADISIHEIHRREKADAPSGTAKALQEALQKAFPERRIGVSSSRLGEIKGIHEIRIANGEESVLIRHEILSDLIFAKNALAAAEFLVRQKPGLYTSVSEGGKS